MATDFFLKIDGIEGESQDAKHKGEIDVASWSFGSTNAGTHSAGGGGGAGKVSMGDFVFVHRGDKATPKLQLANWGGDHIKTATLTVRKAGKDQQEYLKYTFSDLLVSSVSIGGSHGEELPMESVSLNFSKVEIEYKEQKPDGTLGSAVKSGWNLKTNVKV